MNIRNFFIVFSKIFRHNSAFKNRPNKDDLRYWTINFSTRKNDGRSVAASLVNASEFQEHWKYL